MTVCASPGFRAQVSPGVDYQADRQRVEDLFSQGRRLEALPLLEQLVRANSTDDAMLVDLAASLVDHAATLHEQDAAGKERLRARGLLEEARRLGNTSPLTLNLLQLLERLPENGDIKFSDDAQVQLALRAGEAAFSRHDFDEALENYGKALKLDPGNYLAALFTGNTYDRSNNFAKAAGWYEHAAQLDPNVETAYRYYADMLARQGDMVKARAMLIHAAVAEPYNRIVWRELHAWAALNHTELNFVYAGIPSASTVAQAPGSQTGVETADLSSAWDAYRTVREKWQKGGEFQKHYPEEREYRHSLREESEALTAAIRVLERLARDEKGAKLEASNTAVVLLLKLHQAGLIEPYVLFSLGDAGISRDYQTYRIRNRERLEEYMDKFVVPPSAR
ncbi:MAG TPA: tetratricopeptide repeat protein [Bryobacteraceae bacterium]|nr:tetratricopeptide repeat protein [Bryobacteraceae bacterium]